jgi:cell division protein ZapA (FtsZ GTPase activity inhibitor)
VHLHAVVREVEGDVGRMQEVVGEILLDDIALVAAADDEVRHAM